jgi:hypothetical protein
LFIVLGLEPPIAWDLFIQCNGRLSADLEWRAFHVPSTNCPIKHLPQQFEIVIDRAGRQLLSLPSIAECLDVPRPNLVEGRIAELGAPLRK